MAAFNLALSYYFRENIGQYDLPTIEEAQWFFVAKPAFNWGGFFVDGSSPTIHRLPTALFLLWASFSLTRYLLSKRTLLQSASASILLGGLGGLTLDILAYGSVCDWLGFSLPGATIYSMLNISDLMILVSAPVAAVFCFQKLL
ncbi:signal peptidase II, partial [Candidatus Puniceispirillum sp.]|nr:signal peptidase II [Candidatus Puniceispirillum sp.]